ncbi:MAG: outer membrane beta-barrel protein [Candidatus Palauibacterales bacterium]|nr:outer membrane beta-barrel protein [Candidatus Palauibacterales bacterium]
MVGAARVLKPVLASLAASALLLSSTASPARAQVDFGLTAGPTIADFTGSYVDHSIRTWGFTGGAYVEWHLSPRFSLEAAFGIAQMGAFEVETPLRGDAYDYRTSNMQIPLAAVYRVPLSGEAWGFRVFAGGAPVFNTGCDVKPSTQFSFDTECSADTPGGEIASSDILIQFGIGVDRLFGGGSGLGFDARYSIGTRNLWSEAEDNDLTAKNGVLDIKVRFFLPLEGPRS